MTFLASLWIFIFFEMFWLLFPYWQKSLKRSDYYSPFPLIYQQAHDSVWVCPWREQCSVVTGTWWLGSSSIEASQGDLLAATGEVFESCVYLPKLFLGASPQVHHGPQSVFPLACISAWEHRRILAFFSVFKHSGSQIKHSGDKCMKRSSCYLNFAEPVIYYGLPKYFSLKKKKGQIWYITFQIGLQICSPQIWKYLQSKVGRKCFNVYN